jgi:hypothetical protein
MKKSLFTALAVWLCITAKLMAQVPSYVPTNGLVGWWPFNGNANDESGNGNNGTVNGATLTTDRFGDANKAYSFDGVDDIISVNRNYMSAFSLSIWFSSSNLTEYNPLIDAFDENWEIQLKNTVPDFVSFISSNNYQEFMSSQTTVNNSWYNLVCNFSSNIVEFYLNGNLTDQFNVNPLFNNNGNYFFGASLSGADQYYNGKLDDIGIWNRALTQQEITDLYNATNLGMDNLLGDDLKIYPNPTNDYITIDAGNLATTIGYRIKIEDVHGQEVFQSAVNQKQFYVDLSKWSGNGLYFVYLIDPRNNTVRVRKIVLQ